MEKRLAEWGNDDEEEESEEGTTAKKGLPEKKKRKLLDPKTWERDARLVETATALRQELGGDLFEDHNVFRDRVDDALEEARPQTLRRRPQAHSPRRELARRNRPARHRQDPQARQGEGRPVCTACYRQVGRVPPISAARPCIVEYEPDPDLRDTEQVPLLEPGGIEAFIRREVLPYTPDAWIKEDATKIGYEISFTRHFYQPQPLRTLDEIRADILAVEKEAEGLLDELLKGGAK